TLLVLFEIGNDGRGARLGMAIRRERSETFPSLGQSLGNCSKSPADHGRSESRQCEPFYPIPARRFALCFSSWSRFSLGAFARARDCLQDRSCSFRPLLHLETGMANRRRLLSRTSVVLRGSARRVAWQCS